MVLPVFFLRFPTMLSDMGRCFNLVVPGFYSSHAMALAFHSALRMKRLYDCNWVRLSRYL